jgi:ovo-like protein
MNPGGGGGGRGGRGGGHYGPHSPSSRALPPFYESLKGGGLGGNTVGGGFNNGQQYMNGGSGGSNSYGMMMFPMDCDTGQGQDGGGTAYVGNGSANAKQYSLLQNVGASYGLITVKDDEEDALLDSTNSYNQFEDPMLVDIASGVVVDPLQFTATLTFTSPADQNALFESLSEELFLQRMSTGSPDGSDLLPETAGNITSSIPGPIEPAVDPFPEHNALGLTQRSSYKDTSRNFAAPTHFTKNNMFLNNGNNVSSDSGNGTSSFHNLPKERPELALHISSSGSSQDQPMQQLEVCMKHPHSCACYTQIMHRSPVQQTNQLTNQPVKKSFLRSALSANQNPFVSLAIPAYKMHHWAMTQITHNYNTDCAYSNRFPILAECKGFLLQIAILPLGGNNIGCICLYILPSNNSQSCSQLYP